jgi:hypothetical protein
VAQELANDETIKLQLLDIQVPCYLIKLLLPLMWYFGLYLDLQLVTDVKNGFRCPLIIGLKCPLITG